MKDWEDDTLGPYENADLEKVRLENEKIKYYTQLCDVVVKGVKLYSKDENITIRQNSLKFLERMYDDFKKKI